MIKVHGGGVVVCFIVVSRVKSAVSAEGHELWVKWRVKVSRVSCGDDGGCGMQRSSGGVEVEARRTLPSA